MTTAFMRLREYASRTLPVRQCRAAIVRFADGSAVPTTFGTVHDSGVAGLTNARL
jgi:hypothetical protein